MNSLPGQIINDILALLCDPVSGDRAPDGNIDLNRGAIIHAFAWSSTFRNHLLNFSLVFLRAFLGK